MLALTYAMNALDDHPPFRCITSGFAPYAANVVAPGTPPDSPETSRAFSHFPSFSHAAATAHNPRPKQ